MQRKIVDCLESLEGDLVISGGDLADTGTNYTKAVYQIISTILNTKVGESFLYPYMGFNSDDFEGRFARFSSSGSLLETEPPML